MYKRIYIFSEADNFLIIKILWNNKYYFLFFIDKTFFYIIFLYYIIFLKFTLFNLSFFYSNIQSSNIFQFCSHQRIHNHYKECSIKNLFYVFQFCSHQRIYIRMQYKNLPYIFQSYNPKDNIVANSALSSDITQLPPFFSYLTFIVFSIY